MNEPTQLELPLPTPSSLHTMAGDPNGEIRMENTVHRLTLPQLDEVYAQLKRGELVTSRHLEYDPRELGKTFLCIDMGYFRMWNDAELGQIGLIFKHVSEALPHRKDRMTFMTCNILHKDDLEIIDARLADLIEPLPPEAEVQDA